MSSCLSLTAARNWCIRFGFSQAGLRPATTDLGDGTVIHTWVPKTRVESKPDLVLIHGFGANALWQWIDVVPRFTHHFNVYVPDLLFFGGSFTSRPDRSDSFQAECIKRAVDAHSEPGSGRKLSVAGLSYGGFVAYQMAAQYKEEVERVVICCAAVCMEEKDLEDGVLQVSDLEAAADILVPRTPEKLRELMGFTLYKPPKMVPSCFLADFIRVMCSEFVEERRDLIRAIPKGRKISQIPKINQASRQKRTANSDEECGACLQCREIKRILSTPQSVPRRFVSYQSTQLFLDESSKCYQKQCMNAQIRLGGSENRRERAIINDILRQRFFSLPAFSLFSPKCTFFYHSFKSLCIHQKFF